MASWHEIKLLSKEPCFALLEMIWAHIALVASVKALVAHIISVGTA